MPKSVNQFEYVREYLQKTRGLHLRMLKDLEKASGVKISPNTVSDWHRGKEINPSYKTVETLYQYATGRGKKWLQLQALKEM